MSLPLPRLPVLALLTVCLLALATTQAPAITENEIAGPTRFDTAVEISKDWPSILSPKMVIISTGMDWPDALGGAALSWHDETWAPILLVKQDSIPDAVWAEIERHNPPDGVIILGGTNAVGPAVEQRLNNKFGASNVIRLFGSDRYETANAVASHAIDLLEGRYDGMAFVATGGDFPDSLAVGPMSSRGHWPIFLANPRTDDVPISLMLSKGVTEVVILGGTKAVSQKAQDALEIAFPGKVSRISGADRYVTGVKIAQWAVDRGTWWRWDYCAFATGENFPDALAAGPYVAYLPTSDAGAVPGGVTLITPTHELHRAVEIKLLANKAKIEEVYYLGGTAALSENVRSQIRSILQ